MEALQSPSRSSPEISPSPSSLSSMPPSASINISLANEEVKARDYKMEMKELPPIRLASTSAERTHYEQSGNLFAIIVAMEHLENAYVKDALNSEDYSKACSQLITQFKTCKEAVNVDVDKFVIEYGLECRAALNRFKEGAPATIIHGGAGQSGEKGKELHVFHAVQHFITTMDSLKLGMKAVDQLHPNLTDLVDSINQVSSLPPDHESRLKTKEWLKKVSSMRASEELSDDDVRQMSFDLDHAYNSFHRFVQDNK